MRLLNPITAALVATVAYASTVGSGAPSPNVAQGFINAYLRGNFANLTLPPTTDVTSFGNPGLVQEFQSKANRNLNFALVKPDPNAPVSNTDTLQVFDTMYTAYGNIGPNIAGYPTIDTTTCPSNLYGNCTYQLFTKNYAIFVYTTPGTNTYDVKDPYYTEWNNQGGISGNLGPASSATTAIASVSKLSGNYQNFVSGAIFNYNSTTASGGTVANTYSVFGTTYAAYSAAGGPAALGFPIAQEIVLASGLHRQVFEEARVEWMPGNPGQVIFPVAAVAITNAAAGLSMNLGDTATLTVTTTDTTGNLVTNRAVSWSVSNGQALSIQPNGYSATIKAIGKGVSNVTATAEGKTGVSLLVRVATPCCDIGEGAPTAAITTAFQAAVTRNRLSLVLPNPTPVTRASGGYIQQFTAAAGGTVVISESDKSTVAYSLLGNLYTAYLAFGGFGNSLGYPSTDASPGGTQLFESGAALAGSPVVLVPAAITQKWATSGYEKGSVGAPTAAAASFVSSLATAGQSQSFAGGTIYALTKGGAYLSSGLILARYGALSGPAGSLGAPLSDIFVSGTATRQNFENGYIDLQAGATAAVEHINPRQPAVTAAPARLAPGGKVHVAISGFAKGATLAVSQTGTATFNVNVAAGTYAWDIVIPSTGTPGTFTVSVKDTSSTDTASATYTVVSLPSLAPSFTAVSGDRQSGAPGALLPLPLTAVLKDINGNPLAGIPVFAAASPGTSVQAAAFTDANGIATATVRLPQSGVAIVSLTSGGKVASFSAATVAVTVPGVPALSQQDNGTMVDTVGQTLANKGSQLTALAELIAYYQNQGALAAPNGIATPQLLNTYLTANGGYAISDTGDYIANPWAATAFTGLRGGVSVETPALSRLADIIAAGNPALIGITLTVDGAPGGMTYAVANGIAADGTVQILDSAFGQGSLANYTSGFSSAAGHNISGSLASLIQINTSLISPSGFVLAAPLASGAAAVGPGEICGPALSLSDVYVPGATAPATVGGVQFLACGGVQSAYQLTFMGATSAASVYDLTASNSQPLQPAAGAAYSATRGNAGLTLTPQSLAISSVVNSATFTSGLTAGGLATIFGAGLTGSSAALPTIQVGGKSAYVYAAFPFQVNFQVPAGLPAGSTQLTLNGALGQATQSITIAPTAAAIFGVGASASGLPLGAVANQSGTLNSSTTPAQRGEYIVIYCTGLGAKIAQGSYQVAQSPVKAVLNGVEVIPAYAGVSPGLIGVDQINAQIPGSLPPSLTSTLLLRQNGQDSPAVQVSIQ